MSLEKSDIFLSAIIKFLTRYLLLIFTPPIIMFIAMHFMAMFCKKEWSLNSTLICRKASKNQGSSI